MRPNTKPQPKTLALQSNSAYLENRASRRNVLKYLGCTVVGMGLSLGGQRLGHSKGIEPEQLGKKTPVKLKSSGSAAYFDEPYLVGKLGNALPLRMMQIPSGTFMMGSPANEQGRQGGEGPQHRVSVPGFYMGAFAITQQQYAAIMGNNPSYFTQNGANRPVERVSWDQANAFCTRLSELTGRNYRLPSEAEWEYACRAGTTTAFHVGSTLSTEAANFRGEFYRQQTINVDIYWPNAFGLHNMHGNVTEWCADDYHDSYHGAPSNGAIWLSENQTGLKVLRGGSWSSAASHCRSAMRFYYDQPLSPGASGFRVVCVGT